MALALSGFTAHADDSGLWQPQVRAIVGANNNGANTAIEGFLPLKQNLESVLFLDVRSKYDFDDGFGQDVGLGVRRIVNPDLMIGGYAYLNIQNHDSHQFVGSTLGLEAITSKYDAHVNVYVPISGDRSSSETGSTLSLVGHQLIEQITAIDHRDYAAWGIEGEVGVQVPLDLPENHSLRFDVGAYHFGDPDGDDKSITGAKAGLEYSIGDVIGKGTSLTFTGEVRNDNRDNTQFAGSVRLTVPLNAFDKGSSSADDGAEPAYPVSPGLRKRVNERVRGDIGVRIESQSKDVGSTTRVAINAATNTAFGQFFFADGDNDPLGLGTIGDPTTLDNAVAGAGANGIVVAMGGKGDITTGGVNLAAGQTVIGGGGGVQARLADGSVGTFNFGGSNGTIHGTNPAANVLTLANGNTLSGITVTGGKDGIFGNNINGATLTNVTVTGTAGHGADFTGTSTGVKGSNFTATNNGLDGLHIEGDGTYNFTGTTLLQGNGDDGLDVTGQGTYNFATVNALDNNDAGITVKGTSIAGSITITGGQVTGNKALGDDGVGVFIDPITAHIVLDQITQTGGKSAVVLDHVSGSFTVNGATNATGTTQAAIKINESPAAIRFGDINITNPGTDGMVFTGVNASVIAGNIVVSGLGSGVGLDFSNSQTNFTAQSLNVTGTGGTSSIGIDLVQTDGGTIIITNGGTISNVGTGVRLGIAGSQANTANAQFTFGGGSIGGNLASLDARGLNPGSGLYAFGSTAFDGPQLFDQTNLIFVAAAATGAGDGSSLNDLATIATADANTDGTATFVLVNRGVIDDTDGFTLSAGQTLASFGNGRTFTLGGVPMNVTGDNVQHNTTVSDGAGAATLTASASGDVVTLANNTSLLDFNISGGNANGIHGNGVTGVTLTGMNVSGAALDGVLLEGASNVSGSGLTSISNAGAGLSIQGNGTYNFTGTTTLSDNGGDGLLVNGAAIASFGTLNADGNNGNGVKATGTGAGTLTIGAGTISNNINSAFTASNIGLNVTLSNIGQVGGTNGISLSSVSGSFTSTGPATIDSTTGDGISIANSTATVGFSGDVYITQVLGNAISLNGNSGAVSFGYTEIGLPGLNGIDIQNASGAVNFGTTIVALGPNSGTDGINFAGTNTNVTFGTTNVTFVDGADQTGIDFSGSSTTAAFGVTTITGNGDLNSRGIDLSSTTGNKTITFQQGSKIDNVGIGVDLSSSGTTATSANANFTFGDGNAADGLESFISAAPGGYTVNTIGLDPTLGNYDFDDVNFTGPANLVTTVGGVIMVSQNGGVITAGTDGLSTDVTTISVADADAMLGTQTFAFVGTIDLSATPFTLDSGQSITGFGNGNTITTAGTIQPVNVQGNLGATGANVTGNEGVLTGTGDFLHLLGSNQVRNTAFDFTGASGSVFTVDQSAVGFNNAGGITIEGVTVSNVTAGQTAFEVDGLTTNLSIINNNVNIAGKLVDIDGGSGNITVTRGTLPNSATPGTLTAGGISIANRTGGLVHFTDKVTIGGSGVSLTDNTGAAITFEDIDVTTNGATAFTASGGGTVNVTTGTINATNAGAVSLDGISAAINFASTNATFSSGNGIDLQKLSGTANFGTGTLTNTGSGAAFNVGSATNQSGGNATISYAGTIASNGTGAAASIQELTGGSVTLSGNLTDGNTADGGQIFVGGIDNGTAATVTFSGASKTISSGTTTAVQMGYTGTFAAPVADGNANGTINFTNGGLAITTTTGAGFTAAFGGTVSVSGTGNTITTTTGTALSLDGVTAGAAGINFGSISVNGAATGIALNNVSGGALNLGAVNLQGITSRGVDISGTLGAAVNFDSLNIGLGAINAVGLDLNGASLGASNITAGDFDVAGNSFAGTIGIDMAGTTGTGTIQLGDTLNNNPSGQTSTIAGVGYGVQFSSTTNAKLVFGDGQGPAESSISTTGGQVIHATDSLPTNGDYNFNDVNFTGDTSNLQSFTVYYVTANGTGDGSLANPGSIASAQTSTANVIVLIDKTVDNSQETIDLSGGTFQLDDGQVLLAFKSDDSPVDVSTLGVDTNGGASAAFHFTTIQSSPIISAPTGIDTLRPILQSNNATSVVSLATSGSGTFTGGVKNLIVSNLGAGAGISVTAASASSFFIHDNTITAGGRALDFATTGGGADKLLLSIDGNTLRSTGSALAASFAGQNVSATQNSIAIRSFLGNTVIGGTGGGIAFSNVRFDADGVGGTVNAGTLTIGTTGARVQGDGLSLINTSGTLNLGTVNIANNAGTGLLVDTKGANTTFTLNSSGGSVDTTNGTAVNLDPLTVNMTVASVTSTGGANGIIFDGVAGTFTVTGATSITGTSGFGIDAINANTGTFNFNTVTVNNAASTGGGIHVASGTLSVTGLADIDTTSGTGVSQGAGNASFTGGLTIDTTSGDGYLAVTAGTISVTGSSNTITTSTGRVLSLQTATLGSGGMNFSSLTATGTVSGAGIQIASVSGTGAFNGGAASIAGSSNNAITVQNNTSVAVNFTSATVSSAAFNGIDINGGVTGTVTFGTVAIDNTGASGLRLLNSSATVNINGGSIGATNDPAGIGVEVSGGSATLNMAASVTKTTAGKIVDISGITGGAITLSGNLSATGGFDNGIYAHGNTGGTINFSGATKTLSTGANTAVNLATNTNAAINFTGGGLAITTTSGTGFSATGGGTISVVGSGNSISTGSGTALGLDGVTVGAGGVNFGTVSTTAAATGITLNNIASSGGGAIALGTVNLQGITSRGVDVSGTLGAALSFNDLDIGLNSTTGVAFDLNGATINAAVTANDFDVTNAAAAGTSIGVDLRGATGAQILRLGDAAAGGASASIAGVNTGVFLNSTTNLAFVYGDGEKTIDQGSTISANVGIDASSAPTLGTYNFQDVNFQASPGLGFGVGKFYFVGASATGDGSGRDQNNLATLSTAELNSVATDIIVLVNDNGTITSAGSNADNTLNLKTSQQLRGFGNGPINVALTVPSTIQLASNNISVIDQTPDGAATLTTTDGNAVVSLTGTGNVIDGFTIDGNDGVGGNAQRGILNSGGSNTTISHMTIRNFSLYGADLGSNATGSLVDTVAFNGNFFDLLAGDGTFKTITASGSTATSIQLGGTATKTLSDISISNAGGGLFLSAGGTVNATNVDISNTANQALVLQSDVTATFDATSSIGVTTGKAVTISGRSGGTLNYAGTIAANGAADGIVVSGATGANTLNFTGNIDFGTVTPMTGSAVFINNNATNSTINFSNIDIVSNGTTGFSVTNGGTVNVTTGTVSSTGASAVNLNGVATTTGVNFTSTTSTGGTNNVALTNVTGAGAISLGSGTLSGASGTAFLLSGGSNNVSYGGTVSKTSAGNVVSVSSHTGGTTAFSGTISATGSSGGITLANNTGGTINFTNTLTLTGSNVTGFSATGGGTVNATGTGSTINSGTATALNVVNTNIGSGNLVFQRISSSGGTGAGIILDNTGTAAGNGGLHVTGNGTNVGASGGGVIANKTGGDINSQAADGSATITGTDGVGIFLRTTKDVQLNGLQLNDFSNYAILGSGVTGLTIDHTTINGVNGSNDAVNEGSVWLQQLAGTASITNSSISGGWEDNLHVQNTSGTLNLTVDNVTFGANSASFGNEQINAVANGTAAFNMTVQNSNFSGSRSVNMQYTMSGTASGNVVIANNTITGAAAQVSGAAGIFLTSGGTGSNPALTYNIHDNNINGMVGNGIAIGKGSGTGSFNGTINNNTIVGEATNGGANGISIVHVGGGTSTVAITNNTITKMNTDGIYLQIGDNTSGGNGTLNATVTGNSVKNAVSGFPNAAFELNAGTTAADAHIVHLTLGGAGILQNDFATGGGQATAYAEEVRMRMRFNATTFLSGYTGGPTDDAAVSAWVAARNILSTSGGEDSHVVTSHGSGAATWQQDP